MQQILSKTDAALVVDTPAGNVILPQDTMAEVLLEAEGTNLTIVLPSAPVHSADVRSLRPLS